jgi:hypothetical protein
MKRLILAATALTLAAGCATTGSEQAAAPVVYTVVEADAAIPFANTVRGFRAGKDAEKSLLIEGGNGNWYRATLRDYCARDVRWEQAIALDTGPLNRFDKFSTVLVNGQRCYVERVDKIADPDAPPAPAQPAS